MWIQGAIEYIGIGIENKIIWHQIIEDSTLVCGDLNLEHLQLYPVIKRGIQRILLPQPSLV